MAKLRAVFVWVLPCCLSGCAITPPTERYLIEIEQSRSELTQFILDQARTCWQRDATMMQDGIQVRRRTVANDITAVTAARWAFDIGYQDEFFSAEVAAVADDRSTLSVAEGDFACHLSGECYELGFAEDIKRWLAGDTKCKVEDE